MASTDMDPPPVPLTRAGPRVAVFRYDPKASEDDGESKYLYLPNVQFLECSYTSDASPGSGRFRYEFGYLRRPEAAPTGPEGVFPVAAAGKYVVKQDDRLVVRAYLENVDEDEEVDWVVLFDGFAQVPQMNLGPSQTAVTFQAYMTPVMLWRKPIRWMFLRSSEDPEAGEVVPIGERVRFNPDGEPNATPAGFDVNDGEFDARPVFFDHRVKGDPDRRRTWTLGMAARYCLWTMNKGEEFVRNPDSQEVDAILESWIPFPDPDGVIDPDDPATYTPFPIDVQDLEITGDVLPVALSRLLEPNGFTFRFKLVNDDAGNPKWSVVIQRKDTPFPLKFVYLQAGQADFKPPVVYDASKTNAAELELSRDGTVTNEFEAMTAPVAYQVGACLAVLNEVTAADADPGNVEKFNKSDPDYVNKYRKFGMDECGEGHTVFGVDEVPSLVYDVPDLSDVFGTTAIVPGEGLPPAYAARPRPAKGHLFDEDADGAKKRCELWISKNYAGKVPGLWDGTGTWQRCTDSGWSLMDDRWGVEITEQNINDWHIGPPPGDAPFAAGVVNVVDCLCKPGVNQSAARFTLLLIAVVDSDHGLIAVADRRPTSPAKYAVRRVDDSRDRFLKQIVHTSALKTAARAAGNDVVRDDTEEALSRVQALRRNHEIVALLGNVRIDRLSTAYEVGDRIARVKGRDISLRQNAGVAVGEGPVYPVVVEIRYMVEPKVQTVLVLGDRRADPPPERSRARRAR